MNFEAFMESIKKHIKEYLPESYQDAQVTIREQQKLNNRYMGLTVSGRETLGSPRLILLTCTGSPMKIHGSYHGRT